jgi:hypothetical protein
MTRYSLKTRLTRLEEKKSVKQAILFAFLSVVLVVILLVVGIPALIKLVVFLGDIRSSSQKVETTEALPPATPILQPPVEATNSAKINISGYAEANTTIKLSLNNEDVKELTTDKDGNFSFDVSLKEGANLVKAKAVNSAGKESPSSQEISVIYDSKPPDLEVTSPKDGDKFFDKQKQIKVEGKTDPEITIYVNGRLTMSDTEGKFSATISLNDGDNLLTIKAHDQAGNITTQEVKVSYNI